MIAAAMVLAVLLLLAVMRLALDDSWRHPAPYVRRLTGDDDA